MAAHLRRDVLCTIAAPSARVYAQKAFEASFAIERVCFLICLAVYVSPIATA